MATIKEGYDGKLTTISVDARTWEDDRTAELWISQTGLKIKLPSTTLEPIEQFSEKDIKQAYKDMRVVIDEKGNESVLVETINEVGSETLAYVTLNELLDLRDEINSVIKELVA